MDGVISFDIDGVLANFTRGFTRIGNKLYGTPVGDGAAQQTWMFEDFPELRLDKAKCDGIWDVIKESQYFWANLDPFNASIMHTIDRIKNKVFITNRLGKLPKEQSHVFLERWGVLDPKIIVAKDKAPVAQAEHVVAHLDDYYPNCTAIQDVMPECYIALLSVPYNKVHHQEWLETRGGETALSVDHFIDECGKRGLIQWA